jgi:hypothetical protein
MLTRAAFLIPILSLTAAAQAPVSNWEIVKMLAPATEIRVAAKTSKTVEGRLESVTDSDLVVMLQTGPRSIPRPEVIGVSVHKKANRVRNALIGLGIGTAAGIGIGAGIGAPQAAGCRGPLCGLSTGIDAAFGGGIGLLAGTVTGILWPAGWREIYVP